MTLEALPARPLTMEEGVDLDDSGAFIRVLPAEATDHDDEDAPKLVIGLVLVGDDTVAAAAYDLDERTWTLVDRRPYEDEDEVGDLAQDLNDAYRAYRQAEGTDEDWEDLEGTGMRVQGDDERGERVLRQYREAT